MTTTFESVTMPMNISNVTAVQPLSPLIKNLFLADQIITYITIVLIMLGMGGATVLSEIKRCLRRPWGILICWLSQFGLMPLAAFGLAHALNLRPEYAIGLIIQCSSPGGSMSNVLAFYAKGNVSLSICLTACSTVLAIGAMPLCLFVYGRSWSSSGTVAIPYLTVIISLLVVLIPAAFGLFLKYKLPKYINRITQVCALVGIAGLLVGVGIRAYINPIIFISAEWQLWMVVAILPIMAGAIGMVSSSIIRLPCSSRRTISIETSCQNVALALTVINTSFPAGQARADMQVIPNLYGPAMAIELCITIILFRMCYNRGNCKACDYGDMKEGNSEEIMIGDGESIDSKSDNGVKMIPPSYNSVVVDADEFALEVPTDDIKTKDFGTNTEYKYTLYDEDEFSPYKEKATNTEEIYFQ
ncbi:ileal sodium/bile acid cotransporter-like [Glandiceps talaboti]